jgi:translocation protein SEC62
MSQPEIPKDVLAITKFLQSSASELKTRDGVLNGQRAVFFKGKHAVNALLREPFQKKKVLEIPDREVGNQYLQKLLENHMILQVGKESGNKTLQVVQSNAFNANEYYIWLYQGSQIGGMMMGIGVLVLVFAGVMFPLWPGFMRQGVYYLSMVMIGLLGALMGLGVIRAILWVVLVIVLGRGGWLFPNLFADVGVIESFQPVWRYIRLTIVGTKRRRRRKRSKIWILVIHYFPSLCSHLVITPP